MILSNLSNYRSQRSWAKVIFSQACVKNSVHGGGVCLSACWDPPRPGTPWEQQQTPPQTRHPPRTRPPQTRHTPQPCNPGIRHPPGTRPPRPGTRCTPPTMHPSGIRHPPGPGTHPQDQTPLGADTPHTRHPPSPPWE